MLSVISLPSTFDQNGNVVAGIACPNPNSSCELSDHPGLQTGVNYCQSRDDQCERGDCRTDYRRSRGIARLCDAACEYVCDALDLSDDGAANQSSVGAACLFDYDGNTFGGVCYLSHGDTQLCVPSCQPPALDENGNFAGGEPLFLARILAFLARR